jgi:sigma-B regulation protein RsbU (phosphoserine phosphatase)
MLSEPDPAKAITNLNALLIRSGMADRFVTLVAVVLDPASHTATLVNAGHPSPLIYRRAARDVGEAIGLDVAGLPLGVLEGYEYRSCRIDLDPGDSILAYTDGVTEAMDIHGSQLGTRGIYAAVRGGDYSPKGLGELVVGVVERFAAGRPQQDDIAVVGFGRTGD